MKDKIIALLGERILRLEEDCPSIRDDVDDLTDWGTPSHTAHMAAKIELKAAIRCIKKL